MWTAYWHIKRHDRMVREFKRVGFKTDDTVGIDINADEKPVIFRL
jgi:hypothetical protein